MDVGSFLDLVQGVGSSAPKTSADRPNKLAVIDPSYSGGNAKVTFEGESTLTTRAYAIIDSGYQPSPSDRVLMIPVGTTYAIVGPVQAAPIKPDVWHAPTYAASGTDYDAGTVFGGVRYRKLANGLVIFKGIMNTNASTAASATLFTMPVGYRPGYQWLGSVVAGANVPQRIDITQTGLVQLTGALTSAGYVSFNGVNYLAEQ